MYRVIAFLIGFLVPLMGIGQVTVNQHSGFTRLVNNPDVKALKLPKGTRLTEAQNAIFTQPYDSTFHAFELQSEVWLRFEILNTDTASPDYYLFSWIPYVTIFEVMADTAIQHKGGFMMPYKDREFRKHPEMNSLYLPANEAVTVYVRMTPSPYTNSFGAPRIADNITHFEQNQIDYKYSLPGATFSLVYISGLVVITFFMLILVFKIKKRVYFYYLIYLIFQLIYGLLVYHRNPVQELSFIEIHPAVQMVIFECIQFIFISFYILFILELLEVRRHDALLARIMRGLFWFCLGYALINPIFRVSIPSPELGFFLFKYVRLIVLPINLILIIWVIAKVKSPLVTYFIIGNVFFYTGSVVSVYVSLTGTMFNPESIFFFRNSLNTIFQIGLFGEVVCFSFAVAHHVQLIYRQKEESAQAYIHQLQENQRIQENMNQELDRKVNEKTGELIKVYSEFEKQREKEIKSEFHQKLKETKLLALRSQMNPHFLFNSMNSIKHLILTDRPKDAMNYLDNFAGLLRGVLQNSKSETITVEDELNLLEMYILLEKGRLGPSFEFELNVDDRSELSQYPIPALLLQPFVENAIWHGLQPKAEGQKKLTITFDTRDDLIISIHDTGIGRQEASRFSDKNSTHKSFGIKITRERLALFNHLNQIKIKLNISDLSENGISTGTLVTLTYSI